MKLSATLILALGTFTRALVLQQTPITPELWSRASVDGARQPLCFGPDYVGTTYTCSYAHSTTSASCGARYCIYASLDGHLTGDHDSGHCPGTPTRTLLRRSGIPGGPKARRSNIPGPGKNPPAAKLRKRVDVLRARKAAERGEDVAAE